MAHVDVDRAWLAVVGTAPERLQEHLSAVDAPRMGSKRAQELELDVGQLHGPAVNFDIAPGEVDSESVRLDRLLAGVRRGRRGAAEERSHAASELTDRKRLRDVVVGPELQAEHLVELVVAGREHDDRHAARRAQRSEEHTSELQSLTN